MSSSAPSIEIAHYTATGATGHVAVTVYRPLNRGRLPILLYIPGGGYVSNDGDCHRILYQRMAGIASFIVVVPSYRLAPEHCFPAAHNDCETALQFCAKFSENLGSSRELIAIGGDSAGGSIAAALTLENRISPKLRLKFQFLAYPFLAGEAATASRRELGTQGQLPEMLSGWQSYARNAGAAAHPVLAPLFAKTVAASPPTFLVTAEQDPLRDEGENYAIRLMHAGVPVSVLRLAGIGHGFLTSLNHLAVQEAVVIRLGIEMRKYMKGATTNL